MLVIDRLHAGARHHVVLDFGCVVQLTDVLIPQCSDIMSLSVDIWTLWDGPDVQRIAVVSDINLCACVLKDLLPPPVCRYVKASGPQRIIIITLIRLNKIIQILCLSIVTKIWLKVIKHSVDHLFSLAVTF